MRSASKYSLGNRNILRDYIVWYAPEGYLTGSSIVILLAPSLGMSKTSIAIMGNLTLLCYLIMPAGYWLAAKQGTAASLRLERFISAAGIVLLMAVIPVSFLRAEIASAFLLCGTLLNVLGNGTTAAMMFPIQSNICPAAEQSRYLANIGSLSKFILFRNQT